MTKTFATLFGIVYVVMGIAGLFDTALVGVNGLFAADAAYSVAFMLVGTVLLFAALFKQEATRSITLTVGVVLTVVALSGFLIVPNAGDMFGMFMNSADHLFNLVAGLVLAGTALLTRESPRTESSLRQHFRHAVQ